MPTPALTPAVARATARPIAFDAVLAPSDIADVRTTLSVASFTFVVESYAVALGSRVRRGDPLACLCAPHAAVREAQERATLHLLEAQLADARRAAFVREDATTSLGVSAAEHRVAQSRASLESLRALSDALVLRSPIDGVVAELPPVHPAIAGAIPIARIVEIDPLRLEVAAPLGERLPPPGAELALAVGARRRVGIVRGLAPMVDEAGLVTLVVEVPNRDPVLPAGLRASGSLDVGLRTGVFVPATSVVHASGRTLVVVLGPAGLVARKTRVLARTEDGSQLEITGVNAGERVVVHGIAWMEELDDGRSEVGEPAPPDEPDDDDEGLLD